MNIPPLCRPDDATMFGYSGGMALYVAHWNSYRCLFKLVCNEFVIRYEQTYPIHLN